MNPIRTFTSLYRVAKDILKLLFGNLWITIVLILVAVIFFFRGTSFAQSEYTLIQVPLDTDMGYTNFQSFYFQQDDIPLELAQEICPSDGNYYIGQSSWFNSNSIDPGLPMATGLYQDGVLSVHCFNGDIYGNTAFRPSQRQFGVHVPISNIIVGYNQVIVFFSSKPDYGFIQAGYWDGTTWSDVEFQQPIDTTTPEMAICMNDTQLVTDIIIDLNQCMFQTHLNTYLTRTGTDRRSIISQNYNLRKDLEYLEDLNIIVGDPDSEDYSFACSSAVIGLADLLLNSNISGSTVNLNRYNGFINEIASRNGPNAYGLPPFNGSLYCQSQSLQYGNNTGMPPGRVPPTYNTGFLNNLNFSGDSFQLSGDFSGPFGFLGSLFNQLNITDKYTLGQNPYLQYCLADDSQTPIYGRLIGYILILFSGILVFKIIK